MALELCPASSRTCGTGRFRLLISSEITVCRNQCNVATSNASASEEKPAFRNFSMLLPKHEKIKILLVYGFLNHENY